MRSVALLVAVLMLSGCNSAAKEYEVEKIKLIEWESELEVMKKEFATFEYQQNEWVHAATDTADSQRRIESSLKNVVAKRAPINELESKIKAQKKHVSILAAKAGLP